MKARLRLIVLTHGGSERVVERLLGLDCVEIAGIFIEVAQPRRYSFIEKLRRSVRYDGYLATARKLISSVVPRAYGGTARPDEIGESRRRLEEIARAANIPIHVVSDFHSQSSISLLRASDADLGVVVGTNILRESVFGIPKLGSINLHQGLAPFYRGGPPVFWELFNDERELGLTVHFVAPKVDSGEIILQTAVPLSYDYSYGLNFDAFISDFRDALRDPSAQLVADSVLALAEGTASPRSQDTSIGRRYRLPTRKEKDELRRRLSRRRREAAAVTALAGQGNAD